MKIALCNEVIRDMEFSTQCDLAATPGYSGLELASFYLGKKSSPAGTTAEGALRQADSGAGILITGLHWLLQPRPDYQLPDRIGACVRKQSRSSSN